MDTQTSTNELKRNIRAVSLCVSILRIKQRIRIHVKGIRTGVLSILLTFLLPVTGTIVILIHTAALAVLLPKWLWMRLALNRSENCQFDGTVTSLYVAMTGEEHTGVETSWTTQSQKSGTDQSSEQQEECCTKDTEHS